MKKGEKEFTTLALWLTHLRTICNPNSLNYSGSISSNLTQLWIFAKW